MRQSICRAEILLLSQRCLPKAAYEKESVLATVRSGLEAMEAN